MKPVQFGGRHLLNVTKLSNHCQQEALAGLNVMSRDLQANRRHPKEERKADVFILLRTKEQEAPEHKNAPPQEVVHTIPFQPADKETLQDVQSWAAIYQEKEGYNANIFLGVTTSDNRNLKPNEADRRTFHQMAATRKVYPEILGENSQESLLIDADGDSRVYNPNEQPHAEPQPVLT